MDMRGQRVLCRILVLTMFVVHPLSFGEIGELLARTVTGVVWSLSGVHIRYTGQSDASFGGTLGIRN
jgi:hypothetical protein